MSCSKPVQALSFAEIIKGRDSSVRVYDGMLYAVDLAMVMTGKDRNNAGRDLRELPGDKFQSTKFVERQISNHGGYKTKLVSFQHALELIMVLPGAEAKRTRVQFADILKRYMAGDKSLVTEIENNAESNSPIAQMARASMAAPAGDEATMLGFKRRREELELFRLEEDIKGMVTENQCKEQARIVRLSVELEKVSDPGSSKLDERTRLLLKDTYMNLLILTSNSPAQGQIANGPSPNTPISISSVATELGYKPNSADSQRIGIDLKKRYVKQHGKPPSKHEQICSGRNTYVNSYSLLDRPLVVEALHAYFKPALEEGSEDETSD